MSQRQSRRGNWRPQANFSANRGGRSRHNVSFDPSHLIHDSHQSDQVEVVPYQQENSFNDFNFHPTLTQTIQQRGYQTPTPIQDQAIPHISAGKDVIGLAGTGTGKTAAFLLPLINSLLQNSQIRTLIVAPTRELAVQIKNELVSFAVSTQIDSALLIGGAPMFRQEKTLQRRPHFVIGTPGRIIDLQKRKKLYFEDFSSIVLDEVDRMLDMGFISDVNYIVERLPKQKQALFFSATLPNNIRMLIPKFMNNPITIDIERPSAARTVSQEIISIRNRTKVDVLHELLMQPEFSKVLVFGRTKHGLNKLAEQLSNKGLNVATIHGNKSQNQRQRAIQQFKNHRVQTLLATDVASRGIDIENITHVINYDLPQTKEDYIHRIGRTGRAEKRGKAITFVE